jgi:uncharacterized membrane protein
VDEGKFVLGILVPLSIVTTGGVLLILMAMYQRTKTLEMQHRERLAMIERGVVPAPGREPAEFEQWQHYHDRPAPARGTRMGIMIIAVGVGFMFIVGFTGGAGGAAVGIGGAIVIVGIAFIVNGELQRRSQPRPVPPFRPPDPRGPVGP